MINKRDSLFMGIGTVVFIVCSLTVYFGISVNEKMKMNLKTPDGFYSTRDSINDPINDKLLYQFILKMRVNNPKIIYAQARHESSHYTSDLFRRQSNLFGMKISKFRTKLSTSDKESLVYEPYDTWEESVVDYVLWSFENNVDKLDEGEYFEYLGRVYAEDPLYVQKLKKMIESTDFDKLKR
jgi:hypothetical protein